MPRHYITNDRGWGDRPYRDGLVALQAPWQSHTLAPGLQVALPTPPSLVAPEGQKLQPGSGLWLSMHQGRNAIVIGWFPRKPGEATAPDQVLAAMVAGALHGLHARLTAQRDILFDGWPGVEYRLRNEEGQFSIGRSFVTPTALVQVGISGPSSAALEAPATKLFASVRLPKTLGKGTLAKAGPTFRPYPVGETGVTAEFPEEPKLEEIPLPGEPPRALRRFTGRYGNRSFVVAYLDLPPDVDPGDDPTRRRALLDSMNADVTKSLQGKGVKNTPAKVAEVDGLRTTFTFEDGRMFARNETFLHGRRAFAVLVIVPGPLADAPEVERFFASVRRS